MKKLAFLCASALVLTGMHSAAHATPFPYSRSPTPNNQLVGTFVSGVGTITLAGTTIIIFYLPSASIPDSHSSFNPALTSDPAHSDAPVVQSVTISGGLGSLMSFTGTPYPVTFTSGPTGTLPTTSWGVLISGITATGPGGISCAGNLAGTWTNGAVSGGTIQAGTLSIPSQMLGACSFSGTASGTMRIDN